MADPQKVQEAVNAVENLCSPELMDKEAAIDFLEDVIASLESSKEALEEELENEAAEAEGEDAEGEKT